MKFSIHNRVLARLGDAVLIRTPVRHRAIGSSSKIVDDAGAGKSFASHGRVEAMGGQIHRAKVGSIDKCKIRGGKPKSEIRAHVLPVKTDIRERIQGTAWRQWRPADIIIALGSAPGHPRRRPSLAR